MFKTHRTYTLETGVKNKTIAVFNDGKTIKVLYHNTIVVKSDGRKLTLNTGGWNTVSTRAVINRALELLSVTGAHMFQKNKVLMISYNGIVKEFKDGMTIKSNQYNGVVK